MNWARWKVLLIFFGFEAIFEFAFIVDFKSLKFLLFYIIFDIITCGIVFFFLWKDAPKKIEKEK